jgi:muconolactone delta-isomerase
MEYLVTMTSRVPDGTPEEVVQDIRTREPAHSRKLAAEGHLLRLWRNDDVTPLSPHPNDPPPAPGAGQNVVEFLVTFTLAVPLGTPDQTVQDTKAREARAAHDLVGKGLLLWLRALLGAGRAHARPAIIHPSARPPAETP